MPSFKETARELGNAAMELGKKAVAKVQSLAGGRREKTAEAPRPKVTLEDLARLEAELDARQAATERELSEVKAALAALRADVARQAAEDAARDASLHRLALLGLGIGVFALVLAAYAAFVK